MDIKVLMQTRSDIFEVPGGDTIQLLKTKEYVEKLGVEVDLSLELRPDLRRYDVVHLFHLTISSYENYVRYVNVRKQKKSVILSPIYWNMREFLQTGLYGLERKLYYLLPDGILRRILSKIYNKDFKREGNPFSLQPWISLDLKRQQVEVLKCCDLILPNSRTEAETIMRDFGIRDRGKFLIVPNAADETFKHAKPDAFVSSYGLQNFVLCVGRIEDRKNQLSLIKALKGTDLKLVLIGGSNRRLCMSRYYKQCREKADARVLFIDWMKHEELASAYAAAKVYALPSWYETPGLTSLEAGLAGCNIVTTDRGSTKEYFRQYAWYCNPSDIKSIRNAVSDAFTTNKSERLRQHILENYTWEKTAKKTVEAYERVGKKRKLSGMRNSI